MEHTQAFRVEEARKGKGKVVDITSLSSSKDNGLSNRAFVISGLSTIGMVGSEAERKYQNIIKNAWIFDIRFNIHICNLLKGFIKIKDNNKIIKAGAIPLII